MARLKVKVRGNKKIIFKNYDRFIRSTSFRNTMNFYTYEAAKNKYDAYHTYSPVRGIKVFKDLSIEQYNQKKTDGFACVNISTNDLKKPILYIDIVIENNNYYFPNGSIKPYEVRSDYGIIKTPNTSDYYLYDEIWNTETVGLGGDFNDLELTSDLSTGISVDKIRIPIDWINNNEIIINKPNIFKNYASISDRSCYSSMNASIYFIDEDGVIKDDYLLDGKVTTIGVNLDNSVYEDIIEVNASSLILNNYSGIFDINIFERFFDKAIPIEFSINKYFDSWDIYDNDSVRLENKTKYPIEILNRGLRAVLKSDTIPIKEYAEFKLFYPINNGSQTPISFVVYLNKQI